MENEHATEARRCAAELDVEGARRLWPVIFPHLPATGDDASILGFLHHARTQMPTIRFAQRAYSHAWLTERGLPSGLPDHLRPRAERMYPVVKSAVGYASLSKYVEVRERITGAVNHSILEAEADGKLADSPHVYGRMMGARERERRALFGIRTPMVGFSGKR